MPCDLSVIEWLAGCFDDSNVSRCFDGLVPFRAPPAFLEEGHDGRSHFKGLSQFRSWRN